MKRWIVAALVLLALVVLVSPGIVGRLAEDNVGSGIEWAAPDGDVIVTRQAFERRWFTSHGTHRIEIRDEDLRAFIAAAAGIEDQDAAPAFIVDTHIDHGIIPVTSISHESGSLQPGLASAVSTLTLDTGDGRLIEIPGRVYTRIGLSGATEHELRLEPGAIDTGDVQAKWRDARITLEQPASGHVLEHDAQVSIDGFSLETPEGALELAKLALESDSAADGERLESRLELAIEDVVSPGREAFDVALEIASDGDASATRSLVAALDAVQESPGAEAGFLNPVLAPHVAALFSRGLSFHVKRFDLLLPEGTVALTMDVDVPPTDMGEGFAWSSLLLATTASADLRVPAALVDAAAAANPQAASMVALGFLKQDGDAYVMNAEYAQGLLTVNGAPMPLPMPAAR